jgi:hypothetical protein
VTLPPDRIREVLSTHLMSDGIYVTDCQRRDDGLHVGYETLAPGEGVPQTEIGTVVNALLDLADVAGEERTTTAAFEEVDTWTPEDTHVWVFDGENGERGDDDRTQRGHFELRAGWARALEEGHISETDLSTLVLSTVE